MSPYMISFTPCRCLSIWSLSLPGDVSLSDLFHSLEMSPYRISLLPADVSLSDLFHSLEMSPYLISFTPCRCLSIWSLSLPADVSLSDLFHSLLMSPYMISFTPYGCLPFWSDVSLSDLLNLLPENILLELFKFKKSWPGISRRGFILRISTSSSNMKLKVL